MPTFVQLRVTNLCNLRCKMCGQWGDTGIFRAQSGEDPTDGDLERARIRELIGAKRQLALSDYVRLLDEIAPWKPIVSLFGGEPFLYPDIVPLIAEVKRRGLTCTVITNGGRLEALARELVELGIDSIAVSIDGPPDVHDRIRGRSDSFAKAEAGIRAIAHWREEAFAHAPDGDRDPAGDGAEPGGHRRRRRGAAPPAARHDQRGPALVHPGKRGRRVRTGDAGRPRRDGDVLEGLRVRLGIRLRDPGNADDRARPASQGLRRRRFVDSSLGRPWTSFVPDVPAARVPEYFSNFNETFGHELCPVAWYFAQVEPDGEVCFCGDFPDYFIGNVRTQAFRDIWTGEKAARFRAKLAKEPLPICARCCGNFVYGKWERPARPDASTSQNR